LGAGATSRIYRLSDSIVVKLPHNLEDAKEAHANEQQAFETLENYGRSPYLIPCICRVPFATFLMSASNTLLGIIQSTKCGPEDTYRWMGQLCGGVAFMERCRLSHCDLRPENLLTDKNGNLRINDLGSMISTGKRLPVGTEPYARRLSKEDGKGHGSYGWAGASTETFAIGSIFYSLTRGFYPYADQNLDRQSLEKKLQNKEFPQLSDSENDIIIWKCWNGLYQSVAELEQVFRDLGDGTEWYWFEGETEEWLKERRAECEKWISAG
ncbi:hypothetical protein BU26DRAFT_386601, partial [Trematosphaeria pertusa]